MLWLQNDTNYEVKRLDRNFEFSALKVNTTEHFKIVRDNADVDLECLSYLDKHLG